MAEGMPALSEELRAHAAAADRSELERLREEVMRLRRAASLAREHIFNAVHDPNDEEILGTLDDVLDDVLDWDGQPVLRVGAAEGEKSNA
jgi:hypothetical protein